MYLTKEHGFRMHSGDLMKEFGLRSGGHIPAAGLPPKIIDGVKVWATQSGAPGSKSHRMMCQCPHCPWTGSAGRLHQHMKVHTS